MWKMFYETEIWYGTATKITYICNIYIKSYTNLQLNHSLGTEVIVMKFGWTCRQGNTNILSTLCVGVYFMNRHTEPYHYTSVRRGPQKQNKKLHNIVVLCITPLAQEVDTVEQPNCIQHMAHLYKTTHQIWNQSINWESRVLLKIVLEVSYFQVQ